MKAKISLDKLIYNMELAVIEVERDHERDYPSDLRINEDEASCIIGYLKELRQILNK
jgi:hypothetical protein